MGPSIWRVGRPNRTLKVINPKVSFGCNSLSHIDNDPHTQEAVECLVEKLSGFLMFWDKMALELNESHIQDLLRDGQVKLPTNVWNLQVSHYRECIKEANS